MLFMNPVLRRELIGSLRTSRALTATGVPYHTVDILEDPEIRANLPRYSNWPTFPQLYINGELIGGCDITLELAASGELQRMVESLRTSLRRLA